jgi:hypothetical protein
MEDADNHMRNIKSAVKSLRDGSNGVRQLGLDTVEETLTDNTTVIDYTGLIQRGCQVVVIIKQDGTGGWQPQSWAAKFKLQGGGVVSYAPNTYSVYCFVGDSNGDLLLCSAPILGAT